MTPPPLHAEDRDVRQPAEQPGKDLRVGHLYLDARRRRLFCLNQTARDLYNQGVPFTPADLQGRQVFDSSGQPVTGKELPLIMAWRQEQLAEGRFILPRENKAPWHVVWTASPVHDAEGTLLGVLGSVSCGPPEPDARQMAELAHDLRTPLQSLRLLCALVERQAAPDADVQKVLEAIRSVADRAVQIALELLDCCRGPAIKIGVEETPWFDLEPLLFSMAAEQTVGAQAKGLILTTDFTAVHDWQMQADRSRLGRVLANLLVNAVRYTPRGCVHFAATFREEGERRHLDLSVVDTGPGISEEEQESIFQPFERGQAGKTGDSSGSGLGLAVVDRLVEELGLTLDVYSEFGRGSAFHLLVPAKVLRLKTHETAAS